MGEKKALMSVFYLVNSLEHHHKCWRPYMLPGSCLNSILPKAEGGPRFSLMSNKLCILTFVARIPVFLLVQLNAFVSQLVPMPASIAPRSVLQPSSPPGFLRP